MTYIQIVNQDGVGEVYRANSETNTWNTEVINELSTTLFVQDLSKITVTEVQQNTTPVAVTGVHLIGLHANRNEILQIIVHNDTTGDLIPTDYVNIQTTGEGAFVAITEGPWISVGDILTITVVQGRLIFVNGEYMIITSANIAANTINVIRGALASPILSYAPKGTIIYGLLDGNIMSKENYNQTWNPIPGIYNASLGDPLQIAQTNAARFLRKLHEVGV